MLSEATSSHHLQAATISLLSSKDITGGPLLYSISSFEMTPTTKMSVNAFPYLIALKWPE